ncbi:MAG TPA: alkaline phosphatase family protein [Solimonas sp.]|jgi:predicted AlkP superfamily pyrophosphatase or phosphodiesterase
MNFIHYLGSRGISKAGLSLSALLLAACGSSTEPEPPLGDRRLSVMVVAIDSLMPDEIGPGTPNLSRLKEEGTFFPESRAVFSAETIPNHVAMMTGVYPRRSGIVANNFLDFEDPQKPVDRNLSRPGDLDAYSAFTWIDRQCRRTGVNPEIRSAATLSKPYLFEVFSGNATDGSTGRPVQNVAPDTHWDPETSPAYIGSLFEFTPDQPTMDQALAQLPEADFQFISLGSVDRFTHALGIPPRAATLATADQQVGRLRAALEAAGRWEQTVLIVTSDHGTDVALNPLLNGISTQPMLDSLASCFLPMQAVQNGGTDSLYVLDQSAPPEQRQAALTAARSCLLGAQSCSSLCPGTSRPLNADKIIGAWYTTPNPDEPDATMPTSLEAAHPRFGDLVLAADKGFKFSEPFPILGNPIPGNHGHPATFRNTMLVSGGSPWVRRGVVVAPSIAAPGPFDRLPEQSENVDILPTVAWLLGLRIRASDFPDGRGFDGRVLSQAFTQFGTNTTAAEPTRCGRYQ